MIYAGLDLHKKFSVITAMNEQGKEVIRQHKVTNRAKEIVEIFQELHEPVQVAVEATCSWYWLYDALESEGIAVKLSHPLKTKAIASAKVKNDKIDSRILAHLLRTDLLPLSYVPDRNIRMDRELIRYRASLVRTQTGIKNRIHTVLAKNNITYEFSDLFGKQGKEFLVSLQLPEIHRMALDSYLSVLDTLEQEIAIASKKIESLVKEDDDAKLLMTIPGVGYHSALLIKSEIGDIHRFPSAKRLSAYAGIIPSTYSSGNITFHGHITKQGSSWLRWIMSEVILYCTRKPGHIQHFYHKLKTRKGENIARVAAERKLMEWIYHMLKDHKTYQEVEKIADSWGKPGYVSGLE